MDGGVVGPAEDEPAGQRKSATGKTRRAGGRLVKRYLLVGADVEKTSCLVLGAGGEREARRVILWLI